MKRNFVLFVAMAIAAWLLAAGPALAAERRYELELAWRWVNFSGQKVRAMTVNGGIPGPTLRFVEGETAVITVHNRMDVPSSIHWHGILLPPGMDGVPYISYPPIRPGQSFTYRFKIRQTGTYWYHSHSDLQEQRGVYGGLVITPRNGAGSAGRDYLVLLSDWTDRDPHSVMRGLRRGSEWMSLQKGRAQSIAGAAAAGRLGSYFRRELLRMPAMDLADVAYDRFLANGKPSLSLAAEPGQTVRLRVVNGSSTSYFYLDWAGGPLTIVAADGQEVEPVKVKRLLIAVAETYDLLLKIPGPGSWQLSATAQDGSAGSQVWLGRGRKRPASPPPNANLYDFMARPTWGKVFALTPAGSMGMDDGKVAAGLFDKPGMAMAMGAMKSPAMKSATPGGMPAMSAQAKPMAMAKPGGPPLSGTGHALDFRPLGPDVSSAPRLAREGGPRRPGAPYAKLRAIRSTALPPGRPLKTVRLTLDGDMERYVWSFNNKVLSESDDIVVKKGENARFIFINRTMMHHPLHLHGHFFRVLNGQGQRAPLKHTVDVAPMSTTVIEFQADEVGDWFFHCHLLYHMKAGMARLVHYQGYRPSALVRPLRGKLYQDPWYAWGQATLLSHMSEGLLTAANNRHLLELKWEAGWRRVETGEWEVIATHGYYLNRFASLFAGADLFGQEGRRELVRGVGGVRYLLPFRLGSRFWLDTDLGIRLSLEREFRLTPRLSLFGEAQYDSHLHHDQAAGLRYMINENLSLVGKWHSEYGWGAGVMVSF